MLVRAEAEGFASRVAPELGEFLPEQVTRTCLRQARRPATFQAVRWRTEIDERLGQHEAIDGFLAATARHRQVIGGVAHGMRKV